MINPREALIEAQQHHKRGDFKRALEHYTAVITAMHQDREGFESMWWHLAYYNRGVCHGDLEMWDLAIRDLTVALNTKEGDADALNERGYARIKLGDLDGAIADFSEALKNDPHHPKAATNLSLAETQKGIYG